MPKKIRNFSTGTVRAGYTTFSFEFCEQLISKFKLSGTTPKHLKYTLDDAWIWYKCDEHAESRQPSPKETRELLSHISKLSNELHSTLKKTNFDHQWAMCGKSPLLNMDSLDELTTNFDYLGICSEHALENSVKGTGSPPKKNGTIQYICQKLAGIYKEYTPDRQHKKGIAKESYIEECLNHANIDFMGESKMDAEDRIKKLLNPS